MTSRGYESFRDELNKLSAARTVMNSVKAETAPGAMTSAPKMSGGKFKAPKSITRNVGAHISAPGHKIVK